MTAVSQLKPAVFRLTHLQRLGNDGCRSIFQFMDRESRERLEWCSKSAFADIHRFYEEETRLFSGVLKRMFGSVYPEECALLETIPGSATLPDDIAKARIIRVLRRLDADEFARICTVTPPSHMPHIFKVVKLYDQIQSSMDIGDKVRRADTLMGVFCKLIEYEDYTAALAIVRDVQRRSFSSNAHKAIAEALLASGVHSQGVSVICQFPSKLVQSKILSRVINPLIYADDFEKAEKIAWLIPRKGYRASAMKDLSGCYLAIGNFEKAQAIAERSQGLSKSSQLIKGLCECRTGHPLEQYFAK